ncbi:hypothetical protein [Thermodesulfovibrio hydrogeniphilus]
MPFPFKEIASHPSDARNDSKKYLIFKWLYQLLNFYRYFWVQFFNCYNAG